MNSKLEDVVNHIQKSDKISETEKPLIIEKLHEWKNEEGAINEIAVKLENWWLDLEPIFAELGWV